VSVVGKLLRSERIKKGLDHTDIEAGTGIRASFIKAIEEGRFDALPGEVYVKGFIRNYANFLGLDAAKMVRMYVEKISTEEDDEEVPINAQSTSSTEKSSAASSIIWVVIVVLMICGAAGGIYWWMNGPGKQGVVPPQQQQSNSPTSAPAVPQTAITPTPQVMNRPANLSVRYLQRCWTSVTADGKIVYEGVPTAGETMSWQAERTIIVNFGNAAAVEVAFNGTPVGKLGEQGEVITRTFSVPASTRN
jgi:cytoskeletal protein RodZ